MGFWSNIADAFRYGPQRPLPSANTRGMTTAVANLKTAVTKLKGLEPK
jgi:hypothetical protein